MRRKNNSQQKNTVTQIQTVHPNHIAIHAGKLGAHSADVRAQVPVFEISVKD